MTVGQPQLGMHHRCDTRFPPTCGAFGSQGSAGSSQSSWVTIEKNDGVGSTHSPSLPADGWMRQWPLHLSPENPFLRMTSSNAGFLSTFSVFLRITSFFCFSHVNLHSSLCPDSWNSSGPPRPQILSSLGLLARPSKTIRWQPSALDLSGKTQHENPEAEFQACLLPSPKSSLILVPSI